MRIYLDMCCLKRPFDDQLRARIQIETLAVLAVLQLCREGGAELLSSEALLFENGRNPIPLRRELTAEVLALAKETVASSPSVEDRAMELEAEGFPLLDALHIASAEAAAADVFCTCDDRVLTKARTASLEVRVLSLAALTEEVIS